MKINIVTLFPEVFENFLKTSIVKKAISSNKLKVSLINFRDYSLLRNKSVDDTPYGGGPGMVIKYEPVRDALKSLKGYRVIMSPRGKTLNQKKLLELSVLEELTIVCPHYEGYDERINTLIDEEVSIGDYILTGGEVPALVLLDGIVRLIPGVIANESLTEESFENGLLEYDQYTKPSEIDGLEVPEVLVNGNHKLINRYRLKTSLKKTLKNRPDLIEKKTFNELEKEILKELKEEENDI